MILNGRVIYRHMHKTGINPKDSDIFFWSLHPKQLLEIDHRAFGTMGFIVIKALRIIQIFFKVTLRIAQTIAEDNQDPSLGCSKWKII